MHRAPEEIRDIRPLLLLAFGIFLLVISPDLERFQFFSSAAGSSPGHQIHYLWGNVSATGKPALTRLTGTARPQEILFPADPEQPLLPPRLAFLFFQPVDLNHADEQIMVALPGIGQKLAGRIIDQRREKGKFTSLDELLLIKGVSEKKIARLRGMIAVDQGE